MAHITHTQERYGHDTDRDVYPRENCTAPAIAFTVYGPRTQILYSYIECARERGPRSSPLGRRGQGRSIMIDMRFAHDGSPHLLNHPSPSAVVTPPSLAPSLAHSPAANPPGGHPVRRPARSVDAAPAASPAPVGRKLNVDAASAAVHAPVPVAPPASQRGRSCRGRHAPGRAGIKQSGHRPSGV